MSAPRHFQLFPPPPTQNRTNGYQNRKNPRKCHSNPRGSSPVAPAEEDTKTSGQAEAVILQIIEDTNTDMPYRAESPTPIPSGAENAKISGHDHPQTAPTQKCLPASAGSQSQSSAPDSNKHVLPSHPSSRSPPPFPNIAERSQPHAPNGSAGMRSASSPSPWPAPGRSSSPASVRSGTVGFSSSQTSSETQTTSIFPRYDPRLPLSQQRYYPQLSSSTNLPPDAVSRTAPKTAAAPCRLNEPVAAQAETTSSSELASIEELVHLWDAANGQGSYGSVGTVNLCLRRIDTLTYTLGNRFVPLYTLKTNRMNDIEIHRTHPGKPNTKAPVVTQSLGEIGQCNSENASITLFPKLAEIFAREQALELSRRNRLDPPRAMQAENDAVKRAEAQEACVLSWNPAYSRYDLYHHAFTGDNNNTFNSQSSNTASGMLSLTITSSADTHGLSLQPRPSILITSPQQPQVRPSTPLDFGNDETPLMALNLSTMTLSISTDSILSATSSLYTMDALIATILTVAVFDDASSLVLRDMTIHEPMPEDFPCPYRTSTPILEPGRITPSHSNSTNTGTSTYHNGNTTGRSTSRAGTVEAYEENKQEAALMAQIRSEQQRNRISTTTSSSGASADLRYKNHRPSFHPCKRAKMAFLSWRGAVPDENKAYRAEKGREHHHEVRDSANTGSSSNPPSASIAEIDIERNAGSQFGRPNPSSFAGEEKSAEALPPVAEKRSSFIIKALRALISVLMMIVMFIASLFVRLGRCVVRRYA